MMIKAKILRDRKDSPQQHNKGSKTFFRFSVGSQTFYFGIGINCAYRPCPCPITIRYQHHSVCPHHKKKYLQEYNITPIPPQELSLSAHPHLNQVRIIHSKRMGISYEKKLTYSWRHGALFFGVLKFKIRRSSFKTTNLKILACLKPPTCIARNKISF